MHYARWRKYGDPGIVGSKRKKFEYSICTVEGCGRKQHCKELCVTHYTRRQNGIEALEIRELGTYNTKDGYIRKTFDERGPMPEHRWIMEQYIGRRLVDEENVHHINGVRNDNRIENLELWSKRQPAGQRVADKIEWANEIIAMYGDDPSKYGERGF